MIFECSTESVYPRDQTLYIFARSSGIVKYSLTDVKTFGRWYIYHLNNLEFGFIFGTP